MTATPYVPTWFDQISSGPSLQSGRLQSFLQTLNRRGAFRTSAFRVKIFPTVLSLQRSWKYASSVLPSLAPGCLTASLCFNPGVLLVSMGSVVQHPHFSVWFYLTPKCRHHCTFSKLLLREDHGVHYQPSKRCFLQKLFLIVDSWPLMDLKFSTMHSASMKSSL